MARHKDVERDQVMSETRRLLLKAAIEEFAREGYDGANINRMSKSAGFAKGTIYNYFDSKRALMLTLIAEIADGHLDFIEEEVLQQDSPARRLEVFFEAGFAWVETNLTQGLVMVNNLYGPHTEFKSAMYDAYQPMFGLVSEDIVNAGIQQDVFRKVDPQVTAGLVMNIYLGIASQVNEEGRTWIATEQIVDFTLHALLHQG
jgi:AcrR family transcriptional regulator